MWISVYAYPETSQYLTLPRQFARYARSLDCGERWVFKIVYHFSSGHNQIIRSSDRTKRSLLSTTGIR